MMGSCIIDGCMDVNAFNFNADATVNDNSCLDAINLEYDTVPTNTSTNFNILANSISLTLGNSEINRRRYHWSISNYKWRTCLCWL